MKKKEFLRQKIFNYRNRHATAVHSNEQIHPTELRVEPLRSIHITTVDKKSIYTNQHGIHNFKRTSETNPSIVMDLSINLNI